MKYSIITIILFSCTLVSAQQENKNVLSSTLFKLESNTQTLYNNLTPKFFTSLGYERIFSKWSWSASAQRAYTKINEDCEGCADHYYGTGYLREYNLFAGINYRIVGKTTSKFQLFTGTDLYYANINYSGDFSGGFSVTGVRKSDNYNSFGIRERLGVHFYPTSKLRITFTTSFRLGFTWKKGINESVYQQYTENSKSIPEVKIGYLF